MIGVTDEEIGYSQPVSQRPSSVSPSSLRKVPQTTSSSASIKRVCLDVDGNIGNPNVVVNGTTGAESIAACLEEEDDCSAYFRWGSAGEERLRTQLRRTSTGSGVDGRGNRTIYLTRYQRFPLRRLDSRLALSDRSFGMGDVCADDVVGGV